MSPIGCLLFALLAVFFVIGGVVLRVLELFGLVRRPFTDRTGQSATGHQETRQAGEQSQRSRSSSSSSEASGRKKIFSDDEGEYVDYEEVK